MQEFPKALQSLLQESPQALNHLQRFAWGSSADSLDAVFGSRGARKRCDPSADMESFGALCGGDGASNHLDARSESRAVDPRKAPDSPSIEEHDNLCNVGS